MFLILLYIFAVWGVICTVYLTVRRLLFRPIQAEIVYKSAEEACDAYSALCLLTELGLPVVAITCRENEHDIFMLKKDFPQVEFMPRETYIERLTK